MAGAAPSGRYGPQWPTEFDFPVERGKILELARALRSTHPAFLGDDALAPPTFLTVAGAIWGPSWARPGDSVLGDWGVTDANELHLEEEYRFHGPPLRAGDRLRGTTCLLEPQRKEGRRAGPMTLLAVATEFRDRAGVLVASARQLIARLDAIERLAGPRAPAPQRAPRPPSASGPVPARRHGPLTLEDCVVYQGASGDTSPLHYDPGVLRGAGFDRLFSPGMLQAGLMSIPVAEAFGPARIRRARFRFEEIVDVGETITCSAAVGEDVVALACTRADGRVAVSGEMELAPAGA